MTRDREAKEIMDQLDRDIDGLLHSWRGLRTSFREPHAGLNASVARNLEQVGDRAADRLNAVWEW